LSTTDGVFFIPEMSTDQRVRVFRRNFGDMEEFSGMEVDAYIVITERYVVVFDTLLCPEDASAMVQMVKDQLPGRHLLVVNSHADWDHCWGNAYFTGGRAAPIIAHEFCLTRMLSDEARQELLDFQQRHTIFQNVALVPPTMTFNQRFTIVGGDLSIELIPAPGHHPDHIAVWIPELSLLLAFDAIEKPLPMLENAEAVPSMFATLERLLALQPKRVLCSHGKSTSVALVEENQAYFREIERHSLELLQRHHPTNEELEHASEIIHYSYDEVIAGATEPFDRTFYVEAHDANVRFLLQWLMRKRGDA
jgi:glyoxylase-like metal-dependent hydrolase (beta-lactamase superfamily II)